MTISNEEYLSMLRYKKDAVVHTFTLIQIEYLRIRSMNHYSDEFKSAYQVVLHDALDSAVHAIDRYDEKKKQYNL